MKISRPVGLLAVAALAVFGAACAKKVAATTPPPPAPAAVPHATAPAPVQAAAPAPKAATPVERTRYPDAATQKRIDELLARIQDAYFDYDRHALRPDALTTLQADAHELGDILRQFPAYKLTVEGYCDERGSAEYNMALGDKRASAAKDYVASLGVPAEQMTVVSYGKEKQVCSEHDESCWQQNRRAHFVAMAR